MTLASALFAITTVVAVTEALLYWTTNHLARGFPWLLTEQNILPVPPTDALVRFSESRFDPLLGWSPQPGATGAEVSDGCPISYSISADGSRNCDAGGDGDALAIVVGDSFGFGRLVRDDEAWTCQLARLTNRRVVNWSVGNYGVDQALLRLETKIAGTSSDWVIACVVPETICRIRSSWKHFFEYGNCLAFKPSFALVDGSLELKPTHRAPQSREEYLRNVDAARAEDYFYQRKFLRDTIRRPYVLSMLRRPLRHGGILLALLMSRVGPFEARGRRMAHGVVFRDNARWTRRLFGDTESLRLLRAILLRLQAVSCLHNRRFLLVVIPQFSELSSRPIRTPWTAYFDSLAAAADLEILDLTPTIASMPMRLRRRHYVTGTLGPHLSALGNSLVAALIRDHIETSSAKSQRS